MDKKEAPADAVDIMSEATEAAAGMLPLDMVNALADLVDPAAVAREMPWLAGELTKIAFGQSDVSFGLAHLAAIGDDSAGSATFVVT